MTNPGSPTSRRLLLAGLAGAGLAAGTGAWSPASAARATAAPATASTSRNTSLSGWPTLPGAARTSLSRLVEGNRRFRLGRPQHPDQSVRWAKGLASGQHPFATVLGCVDSRVPVEIVTDQGAGDLFVVRSAGHVLDDAIVGSVEFGVEELHIPLIMVLGHESCGAVTAAIAAVTAGTEPEGSIAYLAEQLTPSVKATAHVRDAKARLDAAVRINTRTTVQHLLTKSRIIREAVEAGKLGIVAARYDLDGLALTPA